MVQILLLRGYDDCRGGIGVTDSQLIRKTWEGTSDIYRELEILAAHNQEAQVKDDSKYNAVRWLTSFMNC